MSNFKVMDDREYMLHRPEIFIGSMSETTFDGIYNFKYQSKYFTPSLVKIIEEIIDNSVDEAIRTNFNHANKISVKIENNPIFGWRVTIIDNGRGIPIVKHDGKYQAELAWTKPRAGSNFNDTDRTTIGRNGVGSACTNYFSKSFVGVSGNGKECVIVKTFNNCETIETILSGCDDDKKGTMVTFQPDLERFNVDTISDDVLEVIKDRLHNLAICYPNIMFTFNDEKVKSFNINNLSKEFHESAFGLYNDNMTLIISPSGDDEEFRHLSYFNGICIKNGGNHIDYIVKGITDALIPMIKRKWKIDVNASQIKHHLLIAIWVRNFDNLKFDSQTKERITNTVGSIKSFLNLDFSRIASKIIATHDIINPMVDSIIRKMEAIEKRKITNEQKKNKKKKIVDHIVANSKNPNEKTLFITEGQCVEENSLVYTNNGIKKIKDITIEDYVYTHKHNLKRVTSTSPSLKKGIRINGRVYSHDHALYVYDKVSDKFSFIKSKDIIKGRHCLVENNLVKRGVENNLHTVTSIVSDTLTLDSGLVYRFSKDHIILWVADGNSIAQQTIRNIKVGDVVII